LIRDPKNLKEYILSTKTQEDEKKKVQNLKYGQPARKIADDENPIDLGEEEESEISGGQGEGSKERKN
jgi:hypothetical protein